MSRLLKSMISKRLFTRWPRFRSKNAANTFAQTSPGPGSAASITWSGKTRKDQESSNGKTCAPVLHQVTTQPVMWIAFEGSKHLESLGFTCPKQKRRFIQQVSGLLASQRAKPFVFTLLKLTRSNFTSMPRVKSSSASRSSPTILRVRNMNNCHPFACKGDEELSNTIQHASSYWVWTWFCGYGYRWFNRFCFFLSFLISFLWYPHQWYSGGFVILPPRINIRPFTTRFLRSSYPLAFPETDLREFKLHVRRSPPQFLSRFVGGDVP